MLRSFIAIDVEKTDKIEKFWKEVSEAGADLKMVEMENLHITLKFLGSTDEKKIDEIESVMRKSIKGMQPFVVKLRGVGFFPNERKIRVIWIGIEDEGKLAKIAKDMEEGLARIGFSREEKEFSPHLTIARVKSQRKKENLLRIIDKYRRFEFGEIEVSNIRLKKSELTPKGPIYTTLREVKLG
ncbi:MAG: RNA 2',3'-cyclic phosphodiesterase [Thermoplasmata archaeon]|nr:MAG: RNA 2',3'-cyclic phosphodiesterase [Thermoplasmata archaeon]RLF39728.1 MAG: RNA 2',3'-cyclic phosphodiesterase [Thermoplasmata archaeon]